MAPPSAIADEIASRARGLNGYVGRIEKVRAARSLSDSDVNRAYAGAFLAFHVAVEHSLERLFLGTVMGRFTYASRSVIPLVSIRSEVVARAIVKGDRKYIDWLPYHLTASRADAFLSGGRPFADLRKTDTAALERLTVMRNAIAHDSAHALKQFRAQFVAGRPLPGSQRSAAGYLRGQHSTGQTRFEFMLAETVAVFRHLCA